MNGTSAHTPWNQANKHKLKNWAQMVTLLKVEVNLTMEVDQLRFWYPLLFMEMSPNSFQYLNFQHILSILEHQHLYNSVEQTSPHLQSFHHPKEELHQAWLGWCSKHSFPIMLAPFQRDSHMMVGQQENSQLRRKLLLCPMNSFSD